MGECKEEYDDYRQKGKDSRRTGCIVAAVAVLLIFILWALTSIYRIVFPVDESNVTAERIEFLEAEYKMDLSNVVPERYYVPGFAQDAKDNFVFYVDDYAEFMENCFFGEITSCENSDVDVFYYCETNPDDDVRMFVRFVEDDGRYCGEVVRYHFP